MNQLLSTRPAAVAGSFYPAKSSELAHSIHNYLDHAHPELHPDIQQRPRALIVPHAGYLYSGEIAASAYSQLIPYAQEISTVVLLGPSHRVPLLGVATSSSDSFQTPLGEIPLQRDIIATLEKLAFVHSADEAHAQEHSLEVQLPFLQTVLPHFKLVPLVIGQADDQQVSELIESLWQTPGILFLISSDLSHFLNYDDAQQCDQATSQAIANLAPEDIQYEQACGRSAIAGMLLSARKHQLRVEMLDLRNSGDTAGSKDRVVGYGAWAFL
ncbi:AmmeMemoRadiSam system protein B [sulfur-oxidizing endosymbiont of Gigantopelta aegis]|uniref:AmmeMemoRadiSam system protein B n=1 Tax=sulfur-oxidizing endosymbiont of Gigantopelta aegis TaxID=2794934 RepID=UPI0018DDE6AD|nr:AmmeMemoRadiSam system protein B [sulfur-oxidizing endosymbiont of Gigantopelta aegis]